MRPKALSRGKRGKFTLAASATVLVAAAVAAASAAASAAPAGRQSAATGTGSPPTVSSEPYGSAFDSYAGKDLPVTRYTLTNAQGVKARILTYGGIVQSIDVPDRAGHSADVVLGFPTLNDYVTKDSPPVTANGGPYFGELIGRYGNRIAKGMFTLDGKTYHLPINNNGNTLHGGLVGFGNHVWSSSEVHGNGTAGVALTIHSPNGDQGFPGNLALTVTYTLNNAGQLQLHYHATTDAPTVVNFTNHSYFNLAGESSGSAANQVVQINADRYTPTDKTQIPTGQLAPVAGTPFDFTTPHTIGSRINDGACGAACDQLLIAQGYDHNWVLNKTGPTLGGLNLAARASDPASGRQLTVWTDQPGVQFYTSNFLNGTLVGISGHIYRQTDAYTFETQHFPDSPNQPNFPSTVLNPGKAFDSTTIFQFAG
jgi:aldose 1-epimerase